MTHDAILPPTLRLSSGGLCVIETRTTCCRLRYARAGHSARMGRATGQNGALHCDHQFATTGSVQPPCSLLSMKPRELQLHISMFVRTPAIDQRNEGIALCRSDCWLREDEQRHRANSKCFHVIDHVARQPVVFRQIPPHKQTFQSNVISVPMTIMT